MKRLFRPICRPVFIAALLATTVAALAGCSSVPAHPAALPSADAPLALIPQPSSVARSPGFFELRQGTPLRVLSQNAQALGVARGFVDLLARSNDLKLDLRPYGSATSGSPAISFELDPQRVGIDGDEGYQLIVAVDHIHAAARTAHGLFNASMTLWQLATVGLKDVRGRSRLPLRIPTVRIDDSPRFAWRGLMLDVARHYMPPATIKQLLDAMAIQKLNVFQWHLSDDQGWRIEIKKYPRLTEVGAWRTPATATAAELDPATGKPRQEGGFYTQDEIRDIVAYAAERYITVVPEIEMPGHAQAAIAAYPRLGSAGDSPAVSAEWGVHTYLYNVDETTFGFLEDVLDEVMALFPGRYIHIGGDEAAKDQWQASATVQQRMRTLGVADEASLQGYFIQRIEKYLGAHGRRLVGWDEILEGGLPPAATVMSWRGTKGGIEAAGQGHDVIMAPGPTLYLDNLQSTAHDEPPGRPGTVTLADLYAYEVVPAELDAQQARHVLGAQINLWTEHMRTPERVLHAALPRMAALAEMTWSAAKDRDWNAFLTRLIPQLARYRALGLDYADSAFAVAIVAIAGSDGHAEVTLSNQVGRGELRYTLDGSAPTPTSRLYQAPLQLALPQTLRANAFAGDQALASPRERVVDRLALLRRNSDELVSCSKKLPLRVEDDGPRDGPRAVFNVDIMDPCWIYAQAPLQGIGRIAIRVGQVPYNFQLWHDSKSVVSHAAAGTREELQVRLDNCSGAVIAALPLFDALHGAQLATLSAELPPQTTARDLCLFFTSRAQDPLWVIDSVQLLPAH